MTNAELIKCLLCFPLDAEVQYEDPGYGGKLDDTYSAPTCQNFKYNKPFVFICIPCVEDIN